MGNREGAEGALDLGHLAEGRWIPLLIASQNLDGGWGHHPGSQSSTESSCWALLALGSPARVGKFREAAARGFEWLRQAQLPNGSWPAFRGQTQGCWATALASLALRFHPESADRVVRGIDWLVKTWPAEGSLWWRLLHRLSSTTSVVLQNDSLRGWSWTPGTASWVEPTSYALILLGTVPADGLSASAARRRRLGENMLYDRMCPDGGWNSGNPLVYDVAGEPRVGPTVWALLALRNRPERPENQKSLAWLQRAYSGIQGPGSLALAHLCLKVYDRPTVPLEPMLETLYLKNQFLQSVMVTSWAILALNGNSTWLSAALMPQSRER